MSWQISSKRSLPFWLLIGAKKLFSIAKIVYRCTLSLSILVLLLLSNAGDGSNSWTPFCFVIYSAMDLKCFQETTFVPNGTSCTVWTHFFQPRNRVFVWICWKKKRKKRSLPSLLAETPGSLLSGWCPTPTPPPPSHIPCNFLNCY